MATKTDFKFTKEGNVFTLSGSLDGQGVHGLETAMDADNIFTLDFDGVDSVNFAALRALLRCRKDGLRFSIINASDDVMELFEDTGVASFINVFRKPKPLDISKYEEFGGGYLSKSFNSEDGDSMLKYYGKRVPASLVYQEKSVARKVFLFGIPTPMVGPVHCSEGNYAIDFERIEGKRSLSRVIADEPERLEEIAVKFAQMCKELHSTPCDMNMFEDRTVFYRNAVINCKQITDDEKAAALSFIDNIPAATTCLHGDMQLSNIITNGQEYLWIDLSDFGYGNPMLDLGMWFFLSKLNSEERADQIFHMTKAQLDRTWEIFAREYFGADTEEEQAAVIAKVEPFAALHMLYLGSCYGFEGGMLDFVRYKLLIPQSKK